MPALTHRRSVRFLYLLVVWLLLAGCSALPVKLPWAPTASPPTVPTERIAKPTTPTPAATAASILPTATASTSKTPTGTVNAALMRVRLAPGGNEPIVGNAVQGDQVAILDRNPVGDWLKVRLANGITGWAAAANLSVNGGAQSQQLPTAEPAAGSGTAVPTGARTAAVTATGKASATGAATAPAPAPGRKGPPTGATIAQLVKVIDGDTIDVSINGVTERVRYVGVDTPERSQPGYKAATEANRALLGTGPLYLLRDISDRDQTRSHRLLRYVFRGDGTLVERELVARGWAQPVEYPPDTFYAKEFRQLAVEAAQKKLGFWAPKPPADGAMPYALTTSAASVRKSPGPGYPVTAMLPKDTPLTVYGRTARGDWLQVRAPSRAGGWVSAGFVRLNVPTEKVPVIENVEAAPTP